MTEPKCKCDDFDSYIYEPAINEDGWICGRCQIKPGEPPGFCPALDRELITVKIDCLLLAMTENKFVHVSNGSAGDYYVGAVAKLCASENLYDQYSIFSFILELMTSHGEYWQKVSDGILAGEDPRRRCNCGALSTWSRAQIKDGVTKESWGCADHPNQETLLSI